MLRDYKTGQEHTMMTANNKMLFIQIGSLEEKKEKKKNLLLWILNTISTSKNLRIRRTFNNLPVPAESSGITQNNYLVFHMKPSFPRRYLLF